MSPVRPSRASGPSGWRLVDYVEGGLCFQQQMFKAAQPPLSALRHRQNKRLSETVRQPLCQRNRRQLGTTAEPSAAPWTLPAAMSGYGPGDTELGCPRTMVP